MVTTMVNSPLVASLVARLKIGAASRLVLLVLKNPILRLMAESSLTRISVRMSSQIGYGTEALFAADVVLP